MKKLNLIALLTLIAAFSTNAQFLSKQDLKKSCSLSQNLYFENSFEMGSDASSVRGKRRWGTERLATEFKGLAFTGSLGFASSALDTNVTMGFGGNLSLEYIFNSFGVGLNTGFFFSPGEETVFLEDLTETTFKKGNRMQIPIFVQARFMGLNDIIKPYAGFQTGVMLNFTGNYTTTVKTLVPTSTTSFSADGTSDVRFGMGPRCGVLFGERILYGLDFSYIYLFKKTKSEEIAGVNVEYDLPSIHMITIQASIVVPF